MLYAKKADTSDEPVTVPGDLHRCGSVFRRKRRVGAKSCRAGSTAGKKVVTHGKHREKTLSSQQCAPERVVVENNTLGELEGDEEEHDRETGNRPVKVIPVNPLNPGIVDENGDPLKGGGGIAKYTINKGQQNKHIVGTNEYKTAAASSGNQRSTLTVDPQSLLPQLGTGQQVGKVEVGLAGSKERIDFGKPIGNFVDRDTGLSVPTTKGIVHYGKDGAHIVPARP
jgi:filamentous hemagglutinin